MNATDREGSTIAAIASYKKPPASSLLIRDRMRAQRTKDTESERALRSALHRRGLRYRIGQKLPFVPRKTFDVVFPRQKVAVLIDGCFWHGCPLHATWPKANKEWWENKLNENRARDQRTNESLVANGWTVVRVWEHVDADVAAERIAEVLETASAATIVVVI